MRPRKGRNGENKKIHESPPRCVGGRGEKFSANPFFIPGRRNSFLRNFFSPEEFQFRRPPAFAAAP